MKPLAHQLSKSKELYTVLKEHGVAYLAGEVRSGKTLTVILTAEMSSAVNILVFTKKAAIDGWWKFKDNMTKNYTITNYEQASKLDKNDYDLVIVDEAHNLGAVPKPTKRVKQIRALAYDKPVILLSGTPAAETKASLFHQFCITKHSPFDQYKNFYRFFDDYGVVESLYIGGRHLKVYKKTKDLSILNPYFVTLTQAEAGIEQKSEDKVHYVELDNKSKHIYNELLTHGVYEDIVCDNDMALRLTLHQLEFSVNTINYIRETFAGKVALMAHFVEQQKTLEKEFPYFDVYSSNKHKEGVDLSMYDHFVIVSSDYSGAGFIQRRERNVNINNTKTATVHHILVAGAISETVYETVSAKRDYNNQVFRQNKKAIQ